MPKPIEYVIITMEERGFQLPGSEKTLWSKINLLNELKMLLCPAYGLCYVLISIMFSEKAIASYTESS